MTGPGALPPSPGVPPPAAGPAAPRTPLWVRIALVASLALNLAVLGLVAGAALRGDRHHQRPPAIADVGFGPFTEALSREDRAALRRAFIARSDGLKGMRAEMRADMEAFAAAITAEPFDPAAAAAVLSGQKARIDSRIALGQELLIDRLSGMSPAERAAFAARLKDGLGRNGRD